MLRSVYRLGLLRRYFGVPWLAYRLGYAARRRAGLLECRTPVAEWSDRPLRLFLTDAQLAEPRVYADYRRRAGYPFFFRTSDRELYRPFFAAWDRTGLTPLQLAEEIGQGRFRYFGQAAASLAFPREDVRGSLPDWHADPFTGQRAPADRHWSRIDEFGHGDIKVIWELSRFGFAYTLVRAYWRTADERYAERFWRLVEDWQQRNPPNRGANWMCGQEAAFRVMAWIFGLYGFLDARATSDERVAAMAQLIAVSAERIAANLSYALSQRNNHGISEALGLWTIGLLFPEFRHSLRWCDTGRRLLEALGRELIYEDGAFAQHSVVYHRLVLHAYLWALRLGDLHGQPFSENLRQRVRAAGEFLFRIQDQPTGKVPCYGQNDGSLILPLNNCSCHDFRPVVQATRYLCSGTRAYESGAWDEDLLWMFGPPALESRIDPPEQRDLQAKAGGYYTLRSQSSFAFTRCGVFRHRPGQADMLHTDLWWRGENIAIDPGTYSYNEAPPWDNALAGTAYHNSVTVDGRDQMERAGRFVWLPWIQGRMRCYGRSPDGYLCYWEGEHDGYARLPSPVRYRRAIAGLGDGWWFVVDHLTSRNLHQYRLHWLFPDAPYSWEPDSGRLQLDLPPGAFHAQVGILAAGSTTAIRSLVRADEGTPRGWHAPCYFMRLPALSLAVEAQAQCLIYWTLFGPAGGRVSADPAYVLVETDQGLATLAWTTEQEGPLFSVVILARPGERTSRLELPGM